MPNVLILGASSDMAVAIARSFARNKYDLELAARRVSRLEPLKSDLMIRYGVNVILVEFDAADTSHHALFYHSLLVQADISICVFGYMPDQHSAQQQWEETEKTIISNYSGAVSILNIIAEDYEKKKQGTIVGISSVAGLRGRQSNYIYGSAKAGFIAYLSGLRNRLYPAHVGVITVLPGFVRTRMTSGLKLPPFLTADPAEVGIAVFEAVRKKTDIIYVKWFWRWIMMLIRIVPEAIFKKLKM
ncbi:MAG TPA: SDR family oxidoreductase [Chitinophagaceae bacterium]|nr:SDR family oxidoreductase [Chitinophagaceae bacterium]